MDKVEIRKKILIISIVVMGLIFFVWCCFNFSLIRNILFEDPIQKIEGALQQEPDLTFLDVTLIQEYNGYFWILDSGMSPKLPAKYKGYCKTLKDIGTAGLIIDDDTKVEVNEKWLNVGENENAEHNGYYIRYTVTKTSVDQDNIPHIDEYIVCVWPKEISDKCHKVYVGGSAKKGRVFARECAPDMVFPITEYPSNEELESDWEIVFE